MDFTALVEVSSAVAFGSYCRVMQCILRGHLPELCTLSILIGVVATIPLIDAASDDDYNGIQFVFWSNLDLCCENTAVEPNSAELSTK